MGTPNCLRSFTYDRTIWKSASETPTVSSARARVASWRARVTPSVDSGTTRLPQCSVVGDRHAVQPGAAKGAAGVERAHRRQTGLGCGHDECTDTLPGAGDHGHLARPGGRNEPELGAVENPSTFGPFGGHGHVAQRPPARLVGQRHGPRGGARGHLREKALTLVASADLPDHRGELSDGGKQGPGGNRPAQLLDDDGGLDDGEAEATVLLGNRQRRPVERDHGSPEALGRLAALDDATNQFERALLVEEQTDGSTQLLLVAREFELHRPPFPAVPACWFDPRSGLRHAGRSGRVYLTTVSASPVLPSRRTVFWEAIGGVYPGGSPVRDASPDRRNRGPQHRREPTLPGHDVCSPTLSGAPLAQRQSNGLLIRRFRVQIPRGALGTGKLLIRFCFRNCAFLV